MADLDADIAWSLASIFRRGDPSVMGEPVPNSMVTRNGGRLRCRAPRSPIKPDPALWPPQDFERLVHAFQAQGFRSACAWYLNDDANTAYARRAANAGRVTKPVLFLNGEWDAINNIDGNRMDDPMRATCPDLSIKNVRGAHWLTLECKSEVTQAIHEWMKSKSL